MLPLIYPGRLEEGRILLHSEEKINNKVEIKTSSYLNFYCKILVQLEFELNGSITLTGICEQF